MCAQRGVDSEMENVREGRRAEKREKEREKGGKRDTENEAKRGRSARREQGGIEGERRNTWFYLQKQSLRGTNTGRH